MSQLEDGNRLMDILGVFTYELQLMCNYKISYLSEFIFFHVLVEFLTEFGNEVL